jgi:hypothetical protein
MKLKFLSLLICFAVLLNSCKKGEKPVEVATSISFKVDGVQKTMTPCNVTVKTDLGTGSTELRLSSKIGDEGILLSFSRTSGTSGEFRPKGLLYFTAATIDHSYQAYLDPLGGFSPIAGITLGEANFTTVTNEYLAGTFKFTGEVYTSGERKEITEGKFGCVVTKI